MEVKEAAAFMGLLLSGQINQFPPWPDQLVSRWVLTFIDTSWVDGILPSRAGVAQLRGLTLSEFSRELLSHRISCCGSPGKPLSPPHLLPCTIPLALCQLISTWTSLMRGNSFKSNLFSCWENQLFLYSSRSELELAIIYWMLIIGFTHMNLFNPHTNPVREGLSLPFLRWGIDPENEEMCPRSHADEDLQPCLSDSRTLFVITNPYFHVFKHLSPNHSKLDIPKLKSHVPKIWKFDYLYKWGRGAKFKQYLNLI